jgi:putative ATPase
MLGNGDSQSSPSQTDQLIIDAALVHKAVPHRHLSYDKNKDMHYDVISAFIKSMRGSDPDAALYWLARMIDGGEDPKFIARRIFILAAEDIGNADPQALLIAEAAFKSAEVIGYPECQLILAQAATYMALAPKSNASCGIFAALNEVRRGPARDVPDPLRDRHRPGSDSYGDYLYPHNYPGAWVDQQYLPDGVPHGAFYQPSERGWEAYRVDAIKRDRAALGFRPPANKAEGKVSAASSANNAASPSDNLDAAAAEVLAESETVNVAAEASVILEKIDTVPNSAHEAELKRKASRKKKEKK